MTVVNITINGQSIHAQSGQTVLEAASGAGIDIPTLCHHPAIEPYGACRVCLVEIERQRTLHPACTFPVSEGMVVHTESPKVVRLRRFVLEMLFSERTHYCMYCAVSGNDKTSDCELQKLAYRYGLTSWEFPPDFSKAWEVDATREHFFMDHSRCILCRRCIRACSEIAANHTLGVRARGSRTLVCADLDVPFGDSSCVSCGTCLEVCPTGALIDRNSAYTGHEVEVTETKTTCLACPVGCGMVAVTRNNALLRVRSDWDASNGGLLCIDGRFRVTDPTPARITVPLVRRDGQLTEVGWDEAIGSAGELLLNSGLVAGLISPRATNESMADFSNLLDRSLASNDVSLLYGELPPSDLGLHASLSELAQADCVIVLGGDPIEHQKVLGYLTKRAVDKEARLVVVSDHPTGLDPWASRRLANEDLMEVQQEIAVAERPVVLYAAGLGEDAYALLRTSPCRTRFLPLVRGTNSVGAAQLGLRVRPVVADAMLVMAGDERCIEMMLPKPKSLVVHAAYRTVWVESADVVLPARVWTEQAGHVVNVENRELPVVPATAAPEGIYADETMLALLGQRLKNGHVAK